jgi:predicted dehydrogenase
MLESEELDCAIVLTPEGQHVSPVLAALEAGVNVFVEKPLATDVESATTMVKKAEEVKALFMVGHTLRFDPRYFHIKTAIVAGTFGALRSLYARRNNGSRYFDLYRRTHPVFVLGIHDIDLFHWYTGASVQEVYGCTTGDLGSPDMVWAMLKFSNGCVGVIENTWLVPDGAPSFMDAHLEVIGNRSIAQVQDPDQSLIVWDPSTSTAPPLFGQMAVHGGFVGPLWQEIRHFFDCVRRGTQSDILSPHDALAAVRVAQAIVESSRMGRPVSIDSIEEWRCN